MPRADHGDPESLDALGFERFEALYAPFDDADHEPGRVVRSDRGSVLVATADGVVRAEPSAKLRASATSAAELPAAGDWVAMRTPPGHEVALVEAVLRRASAFTRGEAGESSAGQVIAANIDVVFVVHPIAEEPNLRRIERELALAWESGAVPVVVLSKADLAADVAAAHEAVEAVALGVDVRTASTVTGEGIDELLGYADGHRTVALIGPSGAGKSTLINAMVGEQRQATREVRLGDGKGRHTTVARELVALPNGGVLVDTPGMREVALFDVDDGIAAAFPDIELLAEGCRFRDCSHEDEPGCAVQAAVESGELAADRLASYHKLRVEARYAAAKHDARLRSELEGRWKSIKKQTRALYRDGHKRRDR